MAYHLYMTDTACTLTGEGLTVLDWQTLTRASSLNPKQPASYAIGTALLDATDLAQSMAGEQGIPVTLYTQTAPIADDGRLADALASIRLAVAARAVKLAGQAPAPRYGCAGARHGCQARVQTPGILCARCQHDAA